ncbi:hypothetical protein QQF64_012054 [Cirrhinus molitorella]|uniref:Uncharacterized protein n=1 Tax=Cirrhinus molitorella TaxID=172907 RepID=A0ABR3LXK3_9TELE
MVQRTPTVQVTPLVKSLRPYIRLWHLMLNRLGVMQGRMSSKRMLDMRANSYDYSKVALWFMASCGEEGGQHQPISMSTIGTLD